eukprot:816477-Pleurochrysis_carterae.AAC.2
MSSRWTEASVASSDGMSEISKVTAQRRSAALSAAIGSRPANTFPRALEMVSCVLTKRERLKANPGILLRMRAFAIRGSAVNCRCNLATKGKRQTTEY